MWHKNGRCVPFRNLKCFKLKVVIAHPSASRFTNIIPLNKKNHSRRTQNAAVFLLSAAVFLLISSTVNRDNYQYLDKQPWCVAVNISQADIMSFQTGPVCLSLSLWESVCVWGRGAQHPSPHSETQPTCGFLSQEPAAVHMTWVNTS